MVTSFQLKQMHGGELTPLSAVGVGALARTLTVIGIQPLTLVKTRYEVNVVVLVSCDFISKTYTNDGWQRWLTTMVANHGSYMRRMVLNLISGMQFY